MCELPSIAILVLNYNGQKYLDKCFSSLLNQSYPNFTTYLVDNGSSDRSIPFTKRNFPEVEIFALPRNLGFAEAYNRAVESVPESLVVFLNNDTECDPDWFEKLYHPLISNDNVAAVGSRMVFAARPDIINHGGGYFTYTGIGLDRDFGKNITDPDLPREPFQTAYACGGAALVRKDAFLQVGGFAPEYFIYFEDVDLCFRLWLAGYEVLHVPESRVKHYFSLVFGQESPSKIFLCQKNRLSNMFKHFSSTICFKSMLISSGYDLRRMAIWFKDGHFHHIDAVCKGYLHFLGHLPRLISERRLIRKKRFRTDKLLANRGLILDLRHSLYELKRLQTVKQSLFVDNRQ